MIGSRNSSRVSAVLSVFAPLWFGLQNIPAMTGLLLGEAFALAASFDVRI
jgi:hypothetical protein